MKGFTILDVSLGMVGVVLFAEHGFFAFRPSYKKQNTKHVDHQN